MTSNTANIKTDQVPYKVRFGVKTPLPVEI